jgi:hypothetical protein
MGGRAAADREQRLATWLDATTLATLDSSCTGSDAHRHSHQETVLDLKAELDEIDVLYRRSVPRSPQERFEHGVDAATAVITALGTRGVLASAPPSSRISTIVSGGRSMS